ncbi:MAG TPA: hypothetical protein PLD25_21880 [Chloroflexota bacterium]|nr:hypothetical protein [Chloroflexota bacterium]HUM71039.1 hypothetical protein [Chloroflexota bacterium]
MTPLSVNDDLEIRLPIKRFLLIEQCPADWRMLDLYLFRDDDIVFYVGQSGLAFTRVWEHLRNGFRGRSLVGRFIWCNWPRSLNYQIELMSSRAHRFADLHYNLNASEAALIQQWSPCFNEALNYRPTPLPTHYAAPNARLRCSRNLRQLTREAERAVKMEERQRWLTVSES